MLKSSNLMRLSNEVRVVNHLFSELENSTETGALSQSGMDSLHHEFTALADAYAEAEYEDKEEKESSVEALFLALEGSVTYSRSKGKQIVSVQPTLSLMRLCSLAVQRLGFGYVSDFIAHLDSHWKKISVWSFVLESDARRVRSAFLDYMLTLLTEETEDLNEAELDNYASIPMEWRFQMLGSFDADDDRFDHDEIVKSILKAAQSVEENTKLSYDDISEVLVENARRR